MRKNCPRFLPSFIFFLLLICANISVTAQLKKYVFEAEKMGSPLRIIMMCDDSTKAALLAKQAYALTDSINAIISDYDTSSELSRLNSSSGSAAPIVVSPLLLRLIWHAGMAHHHSRGAFDASIGPLSKLWRKARKENIFPTTEIEEKKKLVNFGLVYIDRFKSTVWLRKTGMSIDFGGIGKGFMANQLLDFFYSKGIRQVMVDAGVDIAVGEAPEGTKGWQIGVVLPETTDQLFQKKLTLEYKAIATSGSIYQYFEHEGKKYSHIIDPRTGYGIQTPRNVTVIAGSGEDADWLATACSILPIKDALKLVKFMNAAILITELSHGQVITHASKNFYNYWK